MLTILNDPSGITGGQRFALDREISLQANIEAHLAAGGGCDLLINGIKVDPLTDPRLDAPPYPGDQITVVRRPEGYAEAIYYIVVLVLIAYTYATMPKAPSQDGAAGKDSPNNKLTTQSNIARAYQGIPDVYGYRRIWPDLIQPSTVEYIDQVKYVTEWLCLSRGRGTIESVQYAESPIEDIEGSSYEIFEPSMVGGYPEFGSTVIADVLEPFASDEVNGQEISYAEFYPTIVRAGTFTATIGSASFTVTVADGPDLLLLKSLAPSGAALVVFDYTSLGDPAVFSASCAVSSYLVASGNATFTFVAPSAWTEAFTATASTFNISPSGITLFPIGPFTMPLDCSRLWWNVNFLRGLKGSVTIRAEWWRIDGVGAEIAGTRQSRDDVFSADTFDQRFYTAKVIPSAGFGRYRMMFTRLSTVIGDGGADVAKLEEIYAVRHYPTKTLPGATILRVTTKATLAATGFSDRKFNVRWTRLVRTLTTDTLSASRNFARAIAHIWRIAGNDMASLDTAALAAINAELGETSQLLRFDGSIDDADVSLGERVQLVANMARVIAWQDGLKLSFTRDQARPYPEAQFDYRNLAKSGESVVNFAAHLPASFDGVEVEYVDEVSQAKKSYIRLDINTGTPAYGTSGNPKKIKMPGCATQAQADNRAHVEARRLIYQRTSVTDTALADASALGLGAMVRWVDPNDFGGDDGLQAGEVRSIAGLLISTSELIDWKGATEGRILFTGQDGRNLGTAIRCTPSGDAVLLDSLPVGLYVADATRQCGSRYAFAVGLTSGEIAAAGLYTMTEKRPAADGTVSLALAQYDARIYEHD